MIDTWQSGDVTLYLGDCMDVMQGMDDKSVDAVITDPPYGIGEAAGKNASRTKIWVAKDYGNATWDNERVDGQYINAMLGIGKEIVLFGGNYYADLLPPSSSWIVWDKVNGKNDFADCELAWTSHDRAVRKIEWTWNGFIRRGGDIKYHPTQKPLGVMRWIIGNYTYPLDTIFDPFMGSGTTGVACVQLGRKFIGIELEPKYFEIAKKRIQEAQIQLRLDI